MNIMMLLQVLLITLMATWVSCTIAGLNYIDPIDNNHKTPSKDSCNPLYWYPKHLPENCYKSKDPKKLNTNLPPIPLPIPVPLPAQPFPFPIPLSYPMPPPYPMLPSFPMPPPFLMPPQYPMQPAPPLPPMPMPMQIFPSPIPLPYGIPLNPTYPILPVGGPPGIPYPLQHFGPRQQAGMVPGVPGLVSDDGGLNILPFSDVYADLLEKHKQKMVRKKLKKVLEDYDYYRRMGRNGRYGRSKLY